MFILLRIVALIEVERGIESERHALQIAMNHKRKKPKNARAGCLLCKPNKANGARVKELGHSGFGKLRAAAAAQAELDEARTATARAEDCQ